MWQGTLNQSSLDVSGQNPDRDYVRLNIEFLKNKPSNLTIVYPDKERIKTFISKRSSYSQDEVKI